MASRKAQKQETTDLNNWLFLDEPRLPKGGKKVLASRLKDLLLEAMRHEVTYPHQGTVRTSVANLFVLFTTPFARLPGRYKYGLEVWTTSGKVASLWWDHEGSDLFILCLRRNGDWLRDLWEHACRAYDGVKLP